MTLRRRITIETGGDEALARELVTKAHENCFIANSVSTPVEIAPTFAASDVQAAA